MKFAILTAVLLLSGCARHDIVKQTDEFTGQSKTGMTLVKLYAPFMGSVQVWAGSGLVDTTVTFRLVYLGADWLFIEKLMFKCDDQVIETPKFDPVREVTSGLQQAAGYLISEDCRLSIKPSTLKAISFAKQLKIRLVGSSSYFDFEVSPEDQVYFREFYEKHIAKLKVAGR